MKCEITFLSGFPLCLTEKLHFEGSEASPDFSSDNISIIIRIIMAYLWKGTEGKPKILGEKSIPVPFCHPKISHGLAQRRNQASGGEDNV
jgi:hypothetical protein